MAKEKMREYDRLKNRVKGHQQMMAQDREMRKEKPNAKMEAETGDFLPSFDFWCDSCQEDFSAPCYKTKHRFYGDTIAVWRTRCPFCDTDCIRNITHKDEDMYYEKSMRIRRDRNKYAWEMLQEGEYGFRTHYGSPKGTFEDGMRKKEERILKEERDAGLKGMSIETKERIRSLLSREY